MAYLKDNLWKALDDLRDSPEDPLDFDQIQEAVDQWRRVRRELEFEDAIMAAENEVAIAFHDAVMDMGLRRDQLGQAQKEVISCLRKVVEGIVKPEPVGKHDKSVTTEQNKPDGKASVRTYTFSPKDGFIEVAISSNVRNEVFDAIKELFDLNK